MEPIITVSSLVRDLSNFTFEIEDHRTRDELENIIAKIKIFLSEEKILFFKSHLFGSSILGSCCETPLLRALRKLKEKLSKANVSKHFQNPLSQIFKEAAKYRRSTLPRELFAKILNFLPFEDWVRLLNVSRIDRELAGEMVVKKINTERLPLGIVNQITFRGCMERLGETSLQLKYLEAALKPGKPFSLTDEDLALCENMRQLQVVKLQGSCGLTDAGLAYIRPKNLIHLELNASEVKGNGLTHFKKMPIKELNLSSCYNLVNSSLEHCVNMPLENINLSKCTQLGDEGIKHLQNILSIKKIHLSWCSHLTNDSLFYCKEMDLKELCIVACSYMDDVGVQYLIGKRLNKFEYLDTSVSLEAATELLNGEQ